MHAQQQAASSEPAANVKSWYEPIEPFHIVGPIYYVGTRSLCAYLFATPDGLILLNGAMPGSAPLIEASIRKLGFDPRNISLLLISHAHADHVGTLADFQQLTGAPLDVMEGDVELLKYGGKTDYLYAKDSKFYFPPVVADHMLKDGATVTFGGVTLTARSTPGHTPGSTTWMTRVEDGGQIYSVVFPDGMDINPGTRLLSESSYPGIANDYRHTFDVLEELRPDIFLGYHAETFDMANKRDRALTQGVKAWVDPEGYRRQIAAAKAKFEQQLATGDH
jgi:metallo-beta-lactamase class B